MLGWVRRHARVRQRTMLNAALSAVLVTSVGEVVVSLPPDQTIECFFLGLGATAGLVTGGALLMLRVQRRVLERTVIRDAECLLRHAAARRHLDGL